MTKFSLPAARSMRDSLLAVDATIDVRIQSHDYCEENPDGTLTGKVLTDHSVHVYVRDAKTGNTVVRQCNGTESAADLIAGMRAELRGRAKATRQRNAVLREMDCE